MWRTEHIKTILRVSSDNFLPTQQIKSASKILRSADCYQQRFIKFPDVGIFHSYAELLHAALLEADPEVSTFIPQPLSLSIGRRKYVPDCYYVKSGRRYVVELKPSGEFDDNLRIPLESFFDYQDIKFEVISNESVLEDEHRALNWLRIIRILISAQLEDTQTEEIKLWESFLTTPKQYLDDVISVGNRFGGRAKEIALLRLIHQGKLTINFNGKDMGLDTEVSSCS